LVFEKHANFLPKIDKNSFKNVIDPRSFLCWTLHCILIFCMVNIIHGALGKKCTSTNQGDQIGLIFVRWAIVYFGQIFENGEKSSPHVWATLFHG
jgi:hypothetical protein